MAKKDNGNKSGKSAFIAVALVALLGMAGFLMAQDDKVKPVSGVKEVPAKASKVIVNENGFRVIPTTDTEGLIETRPIIDPTYFEGEVARMYQYAAEIPGVVDKLYCHCKCKENPKFRHKTLLTCYVDGHASKCGVCMKSVDMAYNMTMEGKTPEAIQSAIDEKYSDHSH